MPAHATAQQSGALAGDKSRLRRTDRPCCFMLIFRNLKIHFENELTSIILVNNTMAEEAYRTLLSESFLDSCSLIDKIIAKAESEANRHSFNKEHRELLVDLLYNRINRIVTRFEQLLSNFNYIYGKKLDVPIETFGYDEKLESLLSQNNTSNNLDMDAVD